MGPEELTLLEVGIESYNSWPRAVERFQYGVGARTPHGFALAPFPGQLGDEASVGRRAPRQDEAGLETVLIYFRQGVVNGIVGWTDRTDQPNLTQAQQIARLLEARVRADEGPDEAAGLQLDTWAATAALPPSRS